MRVGVGVTLPTMYVYGRCWQWTMGKPSLTICRLQEVTYAMSELHEGTWKSRFIARLAELFAQSGLHADAAMADARAHADDCYPLRNVGVPEHEAEIMYRDLKTDMV